MKGVTPCVRIHEKDRMYFFIFRKNKDVLISIKTSLFFYKKAAVSEDKRMEER